MTDNKRQKNKKPNSRRTSRNMQKIIAGTREFIVDHSRIIFPIILIICIAVTVAIALNAVRNKNNQAQEASTETVSDANADGASLELPIPEEELANNAFPEVNNLIMAYYEAVSSGDVAGIEAISNSVDETEKIRIVELSKYIESYPVVEIYTKSGPLTNSYLAYVYTKVKFEGYDNMVPGMQAFFICTAEDGSLYINEGDEEEYITNYIQQVTLQEDVVELYNKMTVEYNELLVNDPALSVFLQELAAQIDVSVGEALAAAEATVSGDEATPEEGTETTEETNTEEVPQETENTTVFATTTTAINVRSSDSESADKLGKLDSGTRLELLEIRPNGWSKITYEGKAAYVKSDYLEIIEDASDIESTGTVTVKTNVNIRSSADETAEKLGVALAGDELELISKQADGWSKVKYKNQVAYVKSEYVE